jgi:mono/diheme cytochrome c family protein
MVSRLPAVLLALLPVAAAPVDFRRDVQPILAKNCFACHGPDDGHRSAGLRLDNRDGALKPRKRGAAVVPGKPDMSLLIRRIASDDDGERMPPPESGDKLKPEQGAILRRWIEQGADYARHWSFEPPSRPATPAVRDAAWPRSPLDAFVLERLERAGLTPSEPADRFAFLRRASLDLRGLPPTPEETAAFAADTRPDAYERMVDRFLADPAYGERWARLWLDLARYADSAGYGSDPLRPNAYRYRDWVIDAFNRNLPYDQFTVEQLAGDLLPNATAEQRMATAFHRNTMTNTEGGTDDEEFRVAAVKDRTDTTMQVWMGLTAGCAKCHNHKFDPLTQKEYYRLYAVFNQTADADRGDESPTLPAPTPAQEAENRRIDARATELRRTLERPTPELEREQAAWEADLKPALTAVPLTVPDAPPDGNGVRLTLTVPAAVAMTGVRIEGAAGKKVSLSVGGDGRAPAARFVRVELPGAGRMLSLAEVQAFRGGVNVAPKGKASQSSTAYGGAAGRAIDGVTNGEYYAANSVTHTDTEANPWWEVRLAEAGPVEQVVVWNRTDGGVGNRLDGAKVLLFDDARNPVWQHTLTKAPPVKAELPTGGPRPVPLADTAPDGTATVHIADRAVSLARGDVLTLHLDGGPAPKAVGLVAEPRLLKRLAVPADVRAVLDVPAANRTADQHSKLAAHFRSVAPSLKPLRDEVAALEKSRPAVALLPVMQELPAGQRRTTRVLVKGDFLNPGEPVEPGVPAAFHALPPGAAADRLALAKWLVRPENPLTARVAVNRLWAQIFGRGLVETEEDFGTQGEPPTHPELLDWLATEYIRLGWDTKALLKVIVTSATYRQSSRVSPELLKRDPANRLLGRMPRVRLEAEMVRDQALALAGLLSRKAGGPSVYPPQPAGLWQAAFNGQRSWTTSTGEDRHRRGLYTFWRRTVPYPSMATFDAPSRETCSVKRVRTNTPLQAFVTLNDPVYVEAAQALARRLVREGGATPETRAAYGLQLCLSRPATPAQVETLVALYRAELARFRADAARAKALATDPVGPVPAGTDEAELAAWTVVANVLLNLDGVLTKG